MYSTKINKLLLVIPITVSITNGIYESWNYLDDYELERENYKTLKGKIEKATIGFGYGVFTGIALTVFSPLIISGATVAVVHSYFKK